MNRYVTFIKLIVEHTYFADNRCRSLDLVLQKEDLRRLENLGLIFKKINVNEWIIACSTGVLEKEKRDYCLADEDGVIGIELIMKEAAFLQYTTLPNYSVKTHYHIDLDHAGRSRLMANGSVSYSITSEQDTIHCELHDNSPGFKQEIIGFMHLPITLQMMHHFFEINNKTPFEIIVAFNGTKVLWEFVLIPRNGDYNRSLILVDKTDEIAFSKVELMELSVRQRAYRVVSQDVVSLRESYDCRIQLWEKKGRRNKLIIGDIGKPALGQYSMNYSDEQGLKMTKYHYF